MLISPELDRRRQGDGCKLEDSLPYAVTSRPLRVIEILKQAHTKTGGRI